MMFDKKNRNSKSYQYHILLTNMIPPYRKPLIQHLQSNFSDFLTLVDTMQEIDRHWRLDLNGINLKVLKSLKIRSRKKGNTTERHINFRLVPLLFRMKPVSVISCEFGFRTLVACVFKKFHKSTALTLWLEMSEWSERNVGKVKTRIRKWILCQADSVVILGDSGKKYIERFQFPGRLFSFSQTSSIPIKKIEELDYRSFDSKVNQIDLLFFTSKERHKNFQGILHLLNKWIKDKNIIMKLKVIGVDEFPFDLKDKLNFEIELLGYIQHEDIITHLDSAHALLFPTLSDVWGLVVNEALARGCLVIGSKYSQAVIDILNPSAGWIFDPLEEHTFFTAMNDFLKVINSAESFFKMKQSALEIAGKLSMSTFVENFAHAIKWSEKSASSYKTRKNVTIITNSINNYRTELFSEMKEMLLQDNISLRVVSTKSSSSVKNTIDISNWGKYEQVRSLGFSFFKKRFSVKLISLTKQSSDLVVLSQSTTELENYVIYLLQKFNRGKVALWGHGYTITKEKNRLARFIQKIMLKNADWFFAYTEGSLNRAREIGYQSNQFTVLGNTFDFRNYSEGEEIIVHSKSDEKWNALYLGSLNYDKSIDELLEISFVVHKLNPKFHLFIAGDGELRETVNHKRYENFATYVGYLNVNQKVKIAKKCKVLLNPGRVGLVAVESFALGLPLITSSEAFHGPEYEYLNSKNSFICSNKTLISTEILNLMKDDSIIAVKKKNCLEMRSKFSIDEMIRSFTVGIKTILK